MRTLCTSLVFLLAATAHAEVSFREVAYEHDGVTLTGVLAWDDAVEGARPGVLVIHEWWGLNDYARERAAQLAEMGYVAFAADMYGASAPTTDRDEARRRATPFYRDPGLARARGAAALDVLAAQPECDADSLGAIGFCFGGTCALRLAFVDPRLDAVVSFHGGLFTPSAEELEGLEASLLVCHGADDPYVPAEAVDGFMEALAGTDADWQFVFYSNAVHAFTNPDAGDDPSAGAAYHAPSAARAWAHMQQLFAERLR